MEINVLIDEGIAIPLSEDWLRGIAEQVLMNEGACSIAELSMVITDQDRIQQLNRDYRGKDEPTDVLAFSAIEETGTDSLPFVPPPDGVLHLGEVIVSYTQAVIQAEEHRHPVEQEMAILITHGVLHLLGYEHDEPERERQMRAREARTLSSMGELE